MDDRSVQCPRCGGWLEFDSDGELCGCDTCSYPEQEDE